MLCTTQETRIREKVWSTCSKASDGQQLWAKRGTWLLGRFAVVAGSCRTWTLRLSGWWGGKIDGAARALVRRNPSSLGLTYYPEYLTKGNKHFPLLATHCSFFISYKISTLRDLGPDIAFYCYFCYPYLKTGTFAL